ncbi:MAG: type II secretion system protein [Pirellulaceae bacterium]
MNNRRLALSLIEIVIVLSILALLASGSMLLLSGTLRSAAQQGLLTEFIDLHTWTRDHSSTRVIEMQFDFEAQQISVQERVIAFSGSSRLSSVIINGAVLESRSIQVPYHHERSSTYAVLFSDESNLGMWVLVCGPSGEIEVFENKPGMQEQITYWTAQWSNVN